MHFFLLKACLVFNFKLFILNFSTNLCEKFWSKFRRVVSFKNISCIIKPLCHYDVHHQTLVGIDEGTNEDEFLVSDLSLDYEENPDLDPEEAEKEAQEWAANDLKKRRELLSKVT